MRLPFALALLVPSLMVVNSTGAASRAAAPITQAASGLPTYDIGAACRALTAVPEASITGPDAAKNCVESEKDAHDRLEREWSKFTSANKTMCIGISKQGQIHPVYSELMTCLEMTREGNKGARPSSQQN
ncbi:MAG: hypothetical protein WAM77_30280 [Xanthobacteraceae bacterium]|jgi:hypothetical protein